MIAGPAETLLESGSVAEGGMAEGSVCLDTLKSLMSHST